MWFKKRSLKKAARDLQEHLGWIERLEQTRLRQLEDALRIGRLGEFDKRQILALNFEIASHASRSSIALGQIEEAADPKDLREAQEERAGLRSNLTALEDLPGIPRRQRDEAPVDQVNTLWAQFIDDRSKLSPSERMAIVQLEAQDMMEEGIYLNVKGETREERLAAQREMAELFRQVDWDEVLRKKSEDEDVS